MQSVTAGLKRAWIGPKMSRIATSAPPVASVFASSAIARSITLCAEEVYPVWPGAIARMHWPLADPASVQTETSAATVAALFRVVRDELRCRLWLLASANLPDGVSLGPPIDAELPAIDALIRASGVRRGLVRTRTLFALWLEYDLLEDRVRGRADADTHTVSLTGALTF